LRQNPYTVELGLCGDTINFVQALSHFSLNRSQIRIRVRTVSSLHRQFANTLQVVVDFVQRAFRRLGDGDAIIRVTGGLRQALDVGREAVGDGLTCSVVLGAVDTQPRGQALDRRTQGGLGFVQVVLGNQSKVVSVDNRFSGISLN